MEDEPEEFPRTPLDSSEAEEAQQMYSSVTVQHNSNCAVPVFLPQHHQHQENGWPAMALVPLVVPGSQQYPAFLSPQAMPPYQPVLFGQQDPYQEMLFAAAAQHQYGHHQPSMTLASVANGQEQEEDADNEGQFEVEEDVTFTRGGGVKQRQQAHEAEVSTSLFCSSLYCIARAL